jgi:hypothetical protein
MEKLVPILIQLIGGAAGGNIVGALLKNMNLSKVIATVSGIIGGIGGGQLADAMGWIDKIFGAGSGTVADVAGHGGASAIGGAVLTAIVAFIKKSMDKNA